MKIRVVPRKYIENILNEENGWEMNKWIISIYSKNGFSPLPDRYNILKLEFDDVSERDIDNNCIFFDETLAKKIVEFINDIPINSGKPIYVHCDAGVSRSGAVGYILNEYFNKYLNDNPEDNKYFMWRNSHIMPNPLVVRLLKNELFGLPFMNIEVNDYEYNEDGEKIDNIERI